MNNVGKDQAELLLAERRASLNRIRQIENILKILSRKEGYELRIDYDNDIIEEI